MQGWVARGGGEESEGTGAGEVKESVRSTQCSNYTEVRVVSQWDPWLFPAAVV